MIKVKIRKKSVMQEALKIDQMGLPDIMVTLIKEDLTSRLNQVRLGLLLKDKPLREQGAATALFNLLDFSEDKFLFSSDALKLIFQSFEKHKKFEDMALMHLDVVALAMVGEEVDDRDWRPGMPTPGPRRSGPVGRPLTLKDLKGMRKSFIKYMKKNAVEKKQLAIDTIDNKFDQIITQHYYETIRNNEAGSLLIAFLRNHPSNEKDLNEKSYKEAIQYVRRFFNEQEVEDQIVGRYSKGFFWYSIGSTACSIEAYRMGHCGSSTMGNSPGGMLYSLREKRTGQKISDSHVTLAYAAENSTVYQIKGKGNCTPDEKYGPYIVDFLKKYEVETIAETGAHSDCDFTEFINYLRDEYPDGNYVDSVEEILEQFVNDIVGENQLDTEYVFFDAEVDHDGEEFYARVGGNVSFTVELPMFSEYEDKDFLEEIFDEEKEKIEDALWDYGLEDADEDRSMLNIQLKFFGERASDPRSRHEAFAEISFPLETKYVRAENVDYEMRQLRSIGTYYREEEIKELGEKVQEYFQKSYQDIINPDGPKAFADVVAALPSLREEFQHFELELDEEDGLLYASVDLSLPLRIRQFSNAGRYSSSLWRPALGDYVDDINSTVDNMRYGQKIQHLLEKERLSLARAAERQLKLDFGPEFEVDEKFRTDEPFGFGMKRRRVGPDVIGDGFTQPKLSIELEISAIDKKSNILYSIEYLRFVEKVLPRVLEQLPRTGAQDSIDVSANRFQRRLEQRSLRENKKIKIKIIR